jgi:type VI secretion system secreted protein VgrG
VPRFELRFECGETSLDVRSFDVEESVSALFSVSILARSPSAEIDLEAIVGKPASFHLVSGLLGARVPSRRWTGVCNHIEQVHAEPTGLSTYSLRIVPVLWLLTQRRNHRIHQHLTIPDVAGRLLAEWEIEPAWEIDRGRYPKLEYKCQYGESDYTFLSRLLEEAGIAFTFADDEARGSVLTLSDRLHLRTARPEPNLPFTDNPNAAAEKEYVEKVVLAHEVRPGAHTVRDFDHRNPAFSLFGEAEKAAPPEDRLEQYHYLPGSFLVERGQPADTPVADEKGIARHEQAYGAELAQRALDGQRVSKRTVSFETNALDLAPGTVMSMDRHPHAELGSQRRLLVTETRHRGAPGAEWSKTAKAVFADAAYRPLQQTQKPQVTGVQSAIVVGRAGQEIDVDELGRVRVQFPWDRQGQSNDDSSSWVRVSQGWAGTGFGLINLPRIGQEVLVGFLGGDPDQPVVVGRVFNKTNPVPYTLPEHKTRSTWKSNSSPATGAGGGFNEIMFEDLAGEELVWMQAQKNQRRLVKNDEIITVGRDRQKLVKRNETEVTRGDRSEFTHGDRVELTKGDRTTVIGGTLRKLVNGDEVERDEQDRLVYVGGDQHLIVMQEKRERVEKDSHLSVGGGRAEAVGAHSLSVGGDQHDKVGKNYLLEAGTEIHLKAGTDLVIEAVSDLTIAGPGGFIRINSFGVIIQGSKVRINCGDSPGTGTPATPAGPKKPLEAQVTEPPEPEPDDVSKTGIAQ